MINTQDSAFTITAQFITHSHSNKYRELNETRYEIHYT